MSLSQDSRVGRLVTPLGKDALCLVEFSGSEGLSELFGFNILAVSENNDVDLDSLLGQACHVVADEGTLGKRYYHGILTEAAWERTEGDLNYYRLLLRPWTWLLGKTSDCRIFHDQTVLDIVSDTFKRRGFSDFRPATTHSYPVLHYTVQYRESDLNFVERLLEQHGITYYFEHTEDKHTLVLADGRASHNPAPGLAQIKFNPGTREHLQAREPMLDHWALSRSLRSGKVELTDYNHLTPNAQMLADRAGAERYQHNTLEVFDFPGTYTKQNDGAFYARIRLEAELCLDKRRQGHGNALALIPGVTTALTKHPRGVENTDYLVVRTDSHIGPQVYRSERSEADQGYSAHYQFQILDIPFRPVADAPKPRIHSLQTASVVGAEGEEIDCDNHGRILVHFPWDRHGDRSCRLRVSQVWGGQGWGGQVIPRIGMEVMVAYLEGDPDRPIVVGCVPNPEDKGVPYELPAKKTKMAWRSTTHKGSGFNEMTFEDQNGQQNLFMHAEKDHTVKVKNNHTHRVDANALHSVGDNHSLQIGSNMSHQVGGGLTQIIGLPPQANAAVDNAAASLLNTDSGAGMAGGGASLASAVAGAVGPGILNQLITLMHNTTTGVAKTENIGVSSLLNIGQTFNTNVGKKYSITAGDEIEITVGKSRIVIKKDGTILILGVHFNFTASGPVQINGEIIDLNKPGS